MITLQIIRTPEREFLHTIQDVIVLKRFEADIGNIPVRTVRGIARMLKVIMNGAIAALVELCRRDNRTLNDEVQALNFQNVMSG